MKATRVAIAVVLVVTSASAILGIGDLAENAVGFSTLESLQTTFLWVGLGALAALPAAVAGGILARALAKSNPSVVVAAVAWTAVEGVILVGSKSGWFGVPVALVLSGVLVFACALLARSADPLAAARTPCLLVLLVAIPAAAVTGWCRPDYDLTLGIRGGRVDEQHPNVVLIVLDTLRADHLGAYGDPRGLSPGFDALAQQGTIFEDAYANAPWTVPSHATLFTGLPPRAHGATTLHHRWLDDRFTTLGESLKGRGYRTAIFSANRYLHEANLSQGFDFYRPIGERFETLWIRPALEILGLPEKWADHGAADGVEAVDGFLVKRGPDDGPLFLVVNLMEPHWRYLPPFVDRREVLSDDLGLLAATRSSMKFYGPLRMAGGQIGGPLDAVLRAMYAAAVRYQDRQLSRLVGCLDARLGSKNTILVITSDHGENLGEAGRYDHVFAVNDHLVHVPLLVRYPPVFPAGKRVEGLCELADVPTTIVEFVSGARLGEGATGRTLVPDRFEPRPFVVVEGDPYYGHLERMASAAGFRRDVAAFAQPLVAIRTLERKLVLQARGAPRLYDIRTDRDETNDLLGVQGPVAEELLRELEAWRGSIEPYRVEEAAPAGTPLSPEARERLRRLGYTGQDD